MALNRITIMGRLCGDPELRYTANQIPVTSFTLAVDRDKLKDGDKQTDFINCVAFRGTAEFTCKYFHKGSMAVATGRLQSSKYEKDGVTRISYEVLADTVYFGEAKKKETFVEVENDDGELPFN